MPSDSYTLIISDIGVSTPIAGSVTNASVAANAAIAFSKLAALNSGNVLVGSGSNVATPVAVSGDVTMSNTGVTTITNDSVTFAKMQNVSGYSILGKPTSSSGNAAEVESSSFMLEASTGFLRQTSATAARSTLGIADAATGNVLLSSGVGESPVYGKVGLTTHVSGILPVANGGTGVGASAYGQIGGQTAGTSTAYTTTYEKLVLITSLDEAAQFDTNGVNNRLRYTGSVTRKFLVFASLDMFTATDGAQFSIKIAKNGTTIAATQCNAAAAVKAGSGIAKLVCNWIIEFATNDYVEIFVASVGGSETGTPQRMRLVATPVF